MLQFGSRENTLSGPDRVTASYRLVSDPTVCVAHSLADKAPLYPDSKFLPRGDD